MYRITKEIHFCYGHRLLNHQGKCRHLHGHNATAAITLEAAQLDEQGMVRDFSDIGAMIKTWVENEIDHTMLLHRDDPFLAVMRQAGEKVRVMEHNPTAEHIAQLLFNAVAEAGYPVTEVTLWETGSASASYRRD